MTIIINNMKWCKEEIEQQIIYIKNNIEHYKKELIKWENYLKEDKND